jgi:TM2 domain-containing membrane protein YozV
MKKFGNFQILGAAITTIGLMFLIMNGLSYLNIIQMAGAGIGSAIVSLLMATNGYLIMLFGVVSDHKTAATKMAAPN